MPDFTGTVVRIAAPRATLLQMNPNGYRDHGSPVRRARAAARAKLPCADCGSGKEPEVRKPRYLSEAWHRDPSSHFGCVDCGRRLIAIEGPAADRPSDLATDRVPDPAGTLRLIAGRDPARVRWLAREGALPEPLHLDPEFGKGLSGVDLRAAVRIRVPAAAMPGTGPDLRWVQAPLVLARHGLPWVIWRVREVEEIVAPVPVTGFPELAVTLAAPSVEAAFVVSIDSDDRWQLGQIRPLRGSGAGALPHRSSRRY